MYWNKTRLKCYVMFLQKKPGKTKQKKNTKQKNLQKNTKRKTKKKKNHANPVYILTGVTGERARMRGM